jgi:hypothetical protein
MGRDDKVVSSNGKGSGTPKRGRWKVSDRIGCGNVISPPFNAHSSQHRSPWLSLALSWHSLERLRRPSSIPSGVFVVLPHVPLRAFQWNQPLTIDPKAIGLAVIPRNLTMPLE